MISVTTDTNIELTPADKKFIDMVNNNITMYGQIPYTIPLRLIIETIKQSAMFFYIWYEKANVKAFVRITPQNIMEYVNNNNSKLSGQVGYFVELPAFVRSVKQVYETNKASSGVDFNRADYDYSPYASIHGINREMYLINEVCKLTFENAINSVLSTTFPFTYNPIDHKLTLGKELTTNLILECSINVQLQFLYSDAYFIRHVIGCCKRELKRLLGGHTKPLGGGVTLNPEEICNNLEDIGEVETIVKQTSTVGDIILFND